MNFEKSFSKTHIEEIPNLNIDSADFVFGSVYANELTKVYPAEKIMNSILVDDYSREFSGEFFHLLQKEFHLETLDTKMISFCEDKETWWAIRSKIITYLGIDYSKIQDKKVNEKKVPYLPFEKYYKWDRKHKILNCVDKLRYWDMKKAEWEEIILSEGWVEIILPKNIIFQRFLEEKIRDNQIY